MYRISCQVNDEALKDLCYEDCGQCDVNIQPLVLVIDLDVSGSM